MNSQLEPLWRFFDQGGPVTWTILAASLLMWTLILERYGYFLLRLPRERRSLERRWQRFASLSGKRRERVRTVLVAAYGLQLRRFLGSIRTLTGTLPLLGLLGTVSGMIDTFEVLAQFGQSNARGTAGGISQALLTTMAGLMTALSGYFFSINLDARAEAEERSARHRLK
jgi:biopolymer transport protein ExbB